MAIRIIEQHLPPFDELKRLAEESPEKLEALRKEMSDEMISHAREEMKPRLRAQQSHIDRVISRCKNANHINVVLMQELSKQVVKFSDAIHNPLDCYQEADVTPFPCRYHSQG